MHVEPLALVVSKVLRGVTRTRHRKSLCLEVTRGVSNTPGFINARV